MMLMSLLLAVVDGLSLMSRREVGIIATVVPTAARADEASLFKQNCAACHEGGGNIVARRKTLRQADLAANGYTSLESLVEITSNGKNGMPGFGAECAPKPMCTYGPRLTTDEIRQLALYITQQAAAGWSS